MTAIPNFTASSANASPTRTLTSSDSTTQGPAMRKGPVPLPNENRCVISVGAAGELGGARPRRLVRVWMLLPVIDRRADKSREQRMRPHRPRLQLGVELAADEPRMIRQLDHLDQRAVRRQPRRPQPEF